MICPLLDGVCVSYGYAWLVDSFLNEGGLGSKN
jgi:hypothetical protein